MVDFPKLPPCVAHIDRQVIEAVSAEEPDDRDLSPKRYLIPTPATLVEHESCSYPLTGLVRVVRLGRPDAAHSCRVSPLACQRIYAIGQALLMRS
jgi:hypothetical protein